jgi:Xaa-Pro aminopeptidase
MSEYTAPFYNRREFISGFTGSAGTAIVTATAAVLFTDGRYFTQAESELSPDWELMRQGMTGVPTPSEYLSKALKQNAVVGIDPFVHSAESMERLQKTLLLEGKNITFKNLLQNPIDSIWTTGRPEPPLGAVRVHPIEYAGKSVVEKLAALRASMTENAASYLVSAALDEIAWLYNIRGADVPCNPVSVSYALVGKDTAHLFVDHRKIGDTALAYLNDVGVAIHPYDEALYVSYVD